MDKSKISSNFRFALCLACGVNAAASAGQSNASVVEYETVRQAWLQARAEEFENDATWVLTSSFMILTMQSGFGLLESGCVRTTTSVNVMMKNVIDVIMGGISYWLAGYGISFGKSFKGLMGTTDFFVRMRQDLQSMLESENSVDIFSHYAFQFTFSSTATTIISGAAAGRMKFRAYMAFSFLNTFLYSFPAHWVFCDQGWLAKLGFYDFAGDGPVHVMGGSTALVAALIVGPRLGRFDPDRAEEFELRDPLTCITGLFMLWWGWLGFNCGSTFGIGGIKWLVASRVAVTTINASIAGGLVGVCVGLRVRKGKIRVDDLVNSILSSLVAVTAGCSTISTWHSLIVGMLGAVVGLSTNEALRHFQIIDDPVGAVGVHGASAILGLLIVGVLANADLEGGSQRAGLLFGGGFYLLGIQTLGVFAILLWSCTMSLLILKALDWTVGLRVDVLTEQQGLDWSEHAFSHPELECPKCEHSDQVRELVESVSNLKEDLASSKLEVLELRALVQDLHRDLRGEESIEAKALAELNDPSSCRLRVMPACQGAKCAPTPGPECV